jgi:transposase
MGEVGIIGLDLAKNVFQAHGAAADGSVVFRRKLSRAQVLKFIAAQPPCVVAMEACASAHPWGRAIGEFGHEVRMVPAAYLESHPVPWTLGQVTRPWAWRQVRAGDAGRRG